MREILCSICIGSLVLALTAQGQEQGQEVQGNANVNATAKARRTSNVHATAAATERAQTSSSATRRVKARENGNVHNKTNVHAMVNVNDKARFTNVTRITSNGRTFDRAVFRDRDDWHLHLGFHDRIFFINRFSEVILINGCSFFLDEGIFWPAFIIGESCVPAPNVVFVAVF